VRCFTSAIALYLAVLLAGLTPTARAREIDQINSFLVKMGLSAAICSAYCAADVACHASASAANAGQGWSLRTAPRLRPRNRIRQLNHDATEKRDELPPPHSITSSARNKSDVGMDIPST
jgi:hypothetical protein